MSLSLEQVFRGLAGRMVGLPGAELAVSPAHGWTLTLVPVAGEPGPWGAAWMLVAGSAGMIGCAMLFTGLAGLFRAPGWLRAFALEWFVVALLWAPAALAASVAPGGGGPAAELYDGLGDPPAGRWAALGLALVLLWLSAGPIGRRSVAVGRAWMRADGREFRRRLARVTAVWPGLVALAGLGAVARWAHSPVAAAWLLVVLFVLHQRVD